MEEIKLTTPLYVALANRKNNWFLGFTHGGNAKNDNFTDVSQNDLRFAIYFKTKEDAERFLSNYLEDKKDIIKPENVKYYQIQSVMSVPYMPNANVFMYNTTCWFSTEAYAMWRRNPKKFEKHA